MFVISKPYYCMYKTFFMKLFLLFVLFIGVNFASYADSSLEGHYQGKNLFVQNPDDEDDFGFCITSVTVNGNPVSDGIESSAFEIDFTEFNVKIGDPVFIVLIHGSGCKPKVLNPEVLKPKSTFEIVSILCKSDGRMSWITKNESGKLAFVIEQFRWNRWVVLGEVNGDGSVKENHYNFVVTPHSGENKVRVTQTDYTNNKRPSQSVSFINTSIIEPQFSPKRVKKIIKFTASGKPIETKYEIFDALGNIVKKGFSSEADCTNLKKAAYYINYDNKSEKFIKS